MRPVALFLQDVCHIGPLIHPYLGGRGGAFAHTGLDHGKGGTGTLARQIHIFLRGSIGRGGTLDAYIHQAVAPLFQFANHVVQRYLVQRVGLHLGGTHLEQQVQLAVLLGEVFLCRLLELLVKLYVGGGDVEVEKLERTLSQTGAHGHLSTLHMVIVFNDEGVGALEGFCFVCLGLGKHHHGIYHHIALIGQLQLAAVAAAQRVVGKVVKALALVLQFVILGTLIHHGAEECHGVFCLAVHGIGLHNDARRLVGNARTVQGELDGEVLIAIIGVAGRLGAYLVLLACLTLGNHLTGAVHRERCRVCLVGIIHPDFNDFVLHRLFVEEEEEHKAGQCHLGEGAVAPDLAHKVVVVAVFLQLLLQIGVKHATVARVEKLFQALSHRGGTLFGGEGAIVYDVAPLADVVVLVVHLVVHLDGALILGCLLGKGDERAQHKDSQHPRPQQGSLSEQAGEQMILFSQFYTHNVSQSTDLTGCLSQYVAHRHSHSGGQQHIAGGVGALGAIHGVVGIKVIVNKIFFLLVGDQSHAGMEVNAEALGEVPHIAQGETSAIGIAMINLATPRDVVCGCHGTYAHKPVVHGTGGEIISVFGLNGNHLQVFAPRFVVAHNAEHHRRFVAHHYLCCHIGRLHQQPWHIGAHGHHLRLDADGGGEKRCKNQCQSLGCLHIVGMCFGGCSCRVLFCRFRFFSLKGYACPAVSAGISLFVRMRGNQNSIPPFPSVMSTSSHGTSTAFTTISCGV